jgi:hypothetical protein
VVDKKARTSIPNHSAKRKNWKFRLEPFMEEKNAGNSVPNPSWYASTSERPASVVMQPTIGTPTTAGMPKTEGTPTTAGQNS